MKKLISLILAAALMLFFAACGKTETTYTGMTVNVGMLKGPTGVGSVYLMDGEYEDTYEFTVTSEATDFVAKLSNGDLDIAALPTNVAASLYNKTNGGVQIIALNTLGVLYVLENGDSINSVSDLSGKTIYVHGQGANPEFVLNHILGKNGVEDVEVIFKDPAEIATLMASGEAEICMLPVPHATTVLMKNPTVRVALDITDEYEIITEDGSVFTMGCVVARTDFITEHPKTVKKFLENYEASLESVVADPKAASELVAKYEITGSAAIAERAIPDCNLVCITGDDIKPAVEGYYNVLFAANPKSVGGSLPDDNFYYVG